MEIWTFPFESLGAAPKSVKGDIDGNGRVSAADAVLPARFVGEDDTLSDAQMLVLLNAEPD